MEKDVNEILDAMRKTLDALRLQIDELSNMFEEKTGNNRDFYNSEIYARFHAFTQDNYRGEPPSNNDWNTLESFFRKTYPKYYQLIAIDHNLTRDQFRLCMLMRLSFSLYAIQKVMDIDGMRITRLKIQVNFRLFGEGKAKTLESHLKPFF